MPLPSSAKELVTFLCTEDEGLSGHPLDAVLQDCTASLQNLDQVWSALTELPLDRHSFKDKYRTDRPAQIVQLQSIYNRVRREQPPRDGRISGFVGVLLASLCGLEVSEAQRQQRLASEASQDQKDTIATYQTHVEACFADTATVSLIIDLYFSPGSVWWTQTFDRETLQFHRFGTTSVILQINERKANPNEKSKARLYALKLVWPPFMRINEIAAATAKYGAAYGVTEANEQGGIVVVHDSGKGWIVMDYIAGRTLDDYIVERKEDRAAGLRQMGFFGAIWDDMAKANYGEREFAVGPIDLATIEIVVQGLCMALAENQRVTNQTHDRPSVHGDLSPSNVIIRKRQGDPKPRPEDFVLIDFGQNYLFTRSAMFGDAAKADFTAPEAREGDPHFKSDAFSLAQIIIAAGDQHVDGRGVVPDDFYATAPGLAELLEDMLEARPKTRLPGSADPIDYFALQAKLQFEFDAASRMRDSDTRSASTLRAMIRELLTPFKGEPLRQFQAYSAIRRWPLNGPHERFLHSINVQTASMNRPTLKETREGRELLGQDVRKHVETRQEDVKRLRRWSIAALIASILSIFFSFWWLFREIPFDRLPDPFPFIGRIADAPDYLYSFFDWFQLTPIDTGITRNDLAVRLTAFSYALLHAKLYQAVYARVTPVRFMNVKDLALPAFVAECWMRGLPFIGTVLVLWVTLRNTHDWVWAVILGQALTFIGNLAAYTLVSRALEKGSTLSNTVPSLYKQVAGYDSVRNWVRGSLFYAVVCAAVGTLIYIGELQDVWLYALMTAALNIFMLYLVKCGLDAPQLRVALHRASFAAKRLGPEVSARSSQAGSSADPAGSSADPAGAARSYAEGV